jgi:glycosyltransferase involved in cell wall biosynthesis
MLKLYNSESKRLENLKAYDAIVTHSDHMLTELIKHGLSPQRAYSFPYYEQAWPVSEDGDSDRLLVSHLLPREPTEAPVFPNRMNGKPKVSLLFAGRMEYLKGAHLFIDALPHAQNALGVHLQAILAGDGRERKSLERRARRIQNKDLQIEFTGWLGPDELKSLMADCDLLVVPSLWPEPFGLVGPEAGLSGVPVAAFDVGGIRDWLSDGVNGFLAPGTPPNSKGLAEAIVKCLRDPKIYAQLRIGAARLVQRFSVANHLDALMQVFSNVTGKDFVTRSVSASE